MVTHSIEETLAHLGVEDATVVHSLRRDTDEVRALLAGLARLHCARRGGRTGGGCTRPDRCCRCPSVAWQHRPYWIFPESRAESGPGGGHDPERHSLLGGRMTVSGAPPRQVWQTYLDMSSRPYPLDHEVVDVEITPAAVLINSFALAAGEDGRLPALADIVLRTPLAVAPPPGGADRALGEHRPAGHPGRPADGAPVVDDEEYEWITHSTATIDWSTELVVTAGSTPTGAGPLPPGGSWQRVDEMFRGWASAATRSRGTWSSCAATTRSSSPTSSSCRRRRRRATSWAHVIDGALTISAVLVTPEYARHQVDVLAHRIGGLQGEPPAPVTVQPVRSPRSPQDTVDVQVADEHGEVVCQSARGLRFSAIWDTDSAVAAPRELVHEVVWRPLDLTVDGVTTELSRVVVVGADPAPVTWPGRWPAPGCGTVRVDGPDEPATVGLTPRDAVLVAPGFGDADESAEQAAERCGWALIRQRAGTDRGAGPGVTRRRAQPRLWCLTRGVRQAVGERSLAHAPLWGIARIIAGEHPDLWGGVVDLADDADIPAETVATVLRRLTGDEDIVSVTGGEVACSGSVRSNGRADGTALQCRPTDTYLITGGLGSLGLMVARWLADRGARRILLAGRRGLPPRADWDGDHDVRTRRHIDGVLELEALGVTVRTLALDITDPVEVAAALDPATHGMPAVRGIVHAAGVVRDAMVDKVDREGLHDVLGPKVNGAMVLHRLFPPGTLDFFVMFSSCGQFTRLTGQTTYAAANSFLDALAAHRHADGHTETTSLGWTSWRGVGMSESISSTMLEANSRGLDAISVTEAFRAWAFADGSTSPYHAILRVLAPTTNAPRLPMLRELTATRSTTEGGTGQAFSVDWVDTPEQELRELVTADVREQAAAELSLAAEDLELRRPLVELGVDSVITVALRVRLQGRYGLELPPNILWNKPTIAALADHIVDSLRPAEPADDDPADDPAALRVG